MKNMAETRNTVRAVIFESGSEIKLQDKIIPRRLKFFETVNKVYENFNEAENKFTKASNQRQFNFMNDGGRVKPPVRMLVYEDSSDEEIGGDKSVRSTPPNLQKRQTVTPGAPTKSRKEFDKKILRPKKLVYCSDRENEEERKEDNVYKNLTEIITMPRKIFHLPTDEELYSVNEQKIISNTTRRGRKKSRNRSAADGTRKSGKSRNAMLNDDKENNAAVIARELNRDPRQRDSDSHRSRSFLKNYNRAGGIFGSQEELNNLFKPDYKFIPLARSKMDEDMNELIPNLVGLWIECCEPNCKKWRYVVDIDDPLMVPEKWYCRMNSDSSANTCSAPERQDLAEDEVFVESKFKAGSIVWAKVIGHPWCPAMVDFCPDFECFYWFDKRDSNVPTQYHVKFFSDKKATRAWIRSDLIKPFVGNDEEFALKARVCRKKLTVAQQATIIKNCEIARSAMSLSITQRLKKYSYNSWKLTLRLRKELDNSQRRSTTSSSHSRSETLTISKTVSDKDAEKCSTTSTKTADEEPKQNINQIKIPPPNFAPADKSSQKCSTLTVSSTDTWSSDTTRTYNDTSSFSCVSFDTEVSNDNSTWEKSATGSKRHAIEGIGKAGEHRQTNVLIKKKLLSIKESEIVFDENETVMESSSELELGSEPRITEVNRRGAENGKGVLNNVENEVTRDDEFPDWIPGSPQPEPSRSLLEIRSMNEKRKRDSGSGSMGGCRSSSERISRNENKENNPQESKYLKTLMKLSQSIDESEIETPPPSRPRSSLSKRQLPDLDLIHKKLLTWQDRSMDKLLSDASDELSKKLRKEAREKLRTEYSSRVDGRTSTAEIRDHSAMIVDDLLTSDASFTSDSSF